ncbi:hypothetical protein A1O1_06351 [Capronia coronata CBS 617.96]|uniref:Uncharacterized protein n=1 Tax=Capronia coronata CBS 617.96 TaxID=1182541 RepID=W9XZL5_9EURO|nr:uncharacterized protein A1O1_06351 [Capronia coronata CBS 617.96]EXJ85982.1 hypothetical protein A1O1_06351 [Capronia coronata CBS 617.96]
MDLDETMTTSTSSTPSALQDTTEIDESFEDDSLFPEPTDNNGGGDGGTDHPRTPPASDHLSASAPGDLSPPLSQPQSQSDEGAVSTTQARGAGTGSSMPNGSHVGANIAATRSAPRSTAPSAIDAAQRGEEPTESQAPNSNERDERPGWGWKNKKAQEELQRAWDSIIDRDFNLKEYGDVVMLGKAQLAQQ